MSVDVPSMAHQLRNRMPTQSNTDEAEESSSLDEMEAESFDDSDEDEGQWVSLRLQD